MSDTETKCSGPPPTVTTDAHAKAALMEEQCKLQISEENERKKDMIEKLCPHNRIGYCEPCEELKMKEEKCVPWAKQCPETGDWKIMRGMSEVVGAVPLEEAFHSIDAVRLWDENPNDYSGKRSTDLGLQAGEVEKDIEDMVNNPKHYTVGGYEAIDVIKAKLTPEEFRGYCKGNVLKYLMRSNYKHHHDRDCEKAEYYSKELADALESKQVEKASFED